MPTELINILIQLPVVAVIVFLMERKDASLERRDRQFQEFLREERQTRMQMMKDLSEAISDTHNSIIELRHRFEQAIAVMEEKTRHKP